MLVFLPIKVGGLTLQFLASICIARLVGAEQFGAYTLAFVAASTISMFLTLGMEQLIVREFPKYMEQRDYPKVKGFLISVAGTFSVMSVAFALVLWGLELIDALFLAPGWEWIMAVACVQALILTLASILTSLQKITTSQFLDSIPRNAIFFSVVLLLLWLSIPTTLVNLFQLTLLSAIPVLIAMPWLLRRPIKAIFTSRGFIFDTRYWYVAAFPIAISSSAQIIRDNTDIFMVNIFLGDFETGIYRAAARGAFIATLISVMAVRVLAPMLSRAIAVDDKGEIQKLLQHAALMSTLLGLLVCFLLGVSSSAYLALYGVEFLSAENALLILIIGRAFEVMTCTSAITLMLFRFEKIVFGVNALGLLLNIILNALLITDLGINGAAISTLISTGFVSIALSYIVVQRLDLDSTVFSTTRAKLSVLFRKNRPIK